MNVYLKYYPNVFIAKCSEQFEKGEVIQVTTKHGKEHDCIIHNFVGYTGTKEEPFYCYSITRADGFNSQEYAKNKAEKLNKYADNADKRGSAWQERSNEGRDFLSLGEPIKVGHHSEKRHRALIERNWKRMENAHEEFKKADTYRSRLTYWEKMAEKINLSMPESLEFFEIQLEEATLYHKGLKDKTIPRDHCYSLVYAKKRVNELKKKYEIAVKLWA